MINRIEAGPRYSSAVIHAGNIYLSGYVPEKSIGKSVADQTADILQQIDETLWAAGTDKSRVLKTNIFLAEISTIAVMNMAWDRWVVPGHTPARATVEARLADPSWGVEIVVEAAL